MNKDKEILILIAIIFIAVAIICLSIALFVGVVQETQQKHKTDLICDAVVEECIDFRKTDYIIHVAKVDSFKCVEYPNAEFYVAIIYFDDEPHIAFARYDNGEIEVEEGYFQ